MKRNGFTLVEMMAVIVLIALLAVIGVATYTNVNESAKEKTLESKKEQIRTSAIKWAKENNISNKTIISVNALVVEGYLTADENEVDKIGVIENPVTGENMICNTVDISLKEGEYIAALNDTEQNCALATQSLVDTNISIKVVNAKNKNVTGSGSIAAWTNQNVMIIVSSSSYDSRATSISYDFEGNTITKQKSGMQKYTGNSYISEASAANYYNVFHINAALILNSKIVVTYNIAGDTSKSRAYTIRIDKEEATANVSSDSEWLTVDKDVYVTVDDGKGSGPKYFYINKDPDINTATRKDAGYKTKVSGLDLGKYYIWTEDIAGNKSVKYKIILELNNVDKTVPACEVLFHGNEGNAGWYKEVPVTPGGKNTVKAGISGMNIGVNTSQNDPEYTAFVPYNEFIETSGAQRTTETTRDGVNYYCHVRTIAGKTATASKNLKLDMTPPTVTIDKTSDMSYSQNKTITLVVKDTLSGLPSAVGFRYGWALNSPDGPIQVSRGGNSYYGSFRTEATMTITGASNLTGKYYLVVELTNIYDVAGNKATNVNGSGASGRAVFGPYYFDNTPPVCGSSNSKTNWTKGSYTVNINCSDNAGTSDQSGCTQNSYSKYYASVQTVQSSSITIADKVGNTTDCPVDVYIDNKAPACAWDNSKDNWTKGSFIAEVQCSDANSGCKQHIFTHLFDESISATASAVVIEDNVGNTKRCPVVIYLDNTAPFCLVTKVPNTRDTTSGVSVTIQYTDQHSGVVAGLPASDSGLKASKTYSVTDVVGNTGSCSVSIVSSDCNCQTCTSSTCADWSCSGGYSCTGTAINCTAAACPKCSDFGTKQACNNNSLGGKGCSWTCGGWTCEKYETYPCNCETCYS